MATSILSNEDTQTIVTTGDTYYVDQFGFVYDSTTNDDTIKSTGTTDSVNLIIDGTVLSDGNAVSFNTGNSFEITIGASGIVRGFNDSSSTIFLEEDYHTLTNHGQISGSWGVFLRNSHLSTLTNTGTISATSVLTGSTTKAAIFLENTTSNEIINSGTLTGIGSTHGIRIINSTNFDIFNTGDISARGAIQLSDSSSGKITNNGTILSSFFAGIEVTMDSSASIVNSGLISSTFRSVFHIGSNIQDIVNSGEMIGGITLGSGADTIDMRGGKLTGDIFAGGGADLIDLRGATIIGEVKGQGGSDTYYVDDADLTLIETTLDDTDLVLSSVDWTLGANFEGLILTGGADIDGTGNTLANVITGTSGNNRIQGDGGNDTISGKGGDDDLRGNDGKDTIGGGNGDDAIRGNGGKDTLTGNSGDDLLRGGQGDDDVRGGEDDDVVWGNKGDDTLRGNDGDDILIGGKGADVMYGGDGSDVFVFKGVDDSLQGVALDIIKDFERNSDFIDLSGLNGALTFIGTSAFSGTGPEVRFSVAASNTNIRVDLDGDGFEEMRFVLEGADTGIGVSDLIL